MGRISLMSHSALGRSSTATTILLALLMIAALAIRTPQLDQPIVRFHPTRHYRSAILARACYYDHARGIAGSAKAVADANRAMQPVGEPQVMEWLACAAYLAAGREDVMIPRLIAVIAWVVGAFPVWVIASRIGSPLGAAIAVALYLFLPYGIVASRNFQPDGLMTLASLWAIVALLRYHDDPRGSRLVTAALLVGVAGLIKPMSVFLTVPAILAAAGTPNKSTTSAESTVGRVCALIAGGLLPPVVYYGFEALTGTLVRDQMRMRFEPHLMATAFFWRGLATMAARVETLPLLAVWAMAMYVAADRLGRRLLAALLAGYAAFAIAFTYHMPTHDYYHLPYLAVAAIGMAAFVARLEGFFNARASAWRAYALCAALAVLGSLAAWPRLRLDDAAMFMQMYQEIGALTEHDTRALFLDKEYGYALMYHGELSGDSWPNRDDLAAEAIDGRPTVDAETRFARDYADWAPNYFIVTDLSSLAASPDLDAMLERRATRVRVTNQYRVYRFTR
jgi:hypothetical protein